MRYPEGKTIQVGDLVWWNEGVCVGFVEEIMETQVEFESWGLSEPSLAFTNLHPFEANQTKHKQHIGNVITGGTVVNSESQIEDEGIGLLTEHERAELEWAIHHAKSIVAEEVSTLPFCVAARMDMDRTEEDWHFHFVDKECKVVATAVFPFRPNTRRPGEQGSDGICRGIDASRSPSPDA
jgi:hypothetical protein